MHSTCLLYDTCGGDVSLKSCVVLEDSTFTTHNNNNNNNNNKTHSTFNRINFVTLHTQHNTTHTHSGPTRKRVEQFRAIRIIQRNVQSYLKLRNWQWWRLFTKVKPLLQVTNAEDQKREMEEEIKRLNDRHDKLKSEMEALAKKERTGSIEHTLYIYTHTHKHVLHTYIHT